MSPITAEDRVMIRDLYDRFYLALNDGDGEVIERCFAPGGHIARYDGQPSTPEFATATGRKWNADPIGTTYQHHVTNVVVDPDPEGREDHCSVRMYFLITGVYEPPRIIVRWSAKANDILQRIDGQWRFLQRRISLNHDATGPHWDGEPPHPEWDFERNVPLEA